MTSSKSIAVAQHVRELIVTGHVATGAFLRLERLAAELDSSVTPVREALFQLKAEGFVDLRPRRGFEVLALTDADLRDVYVAQALLAGELAARATRALSPREIDGLEVIQEQLEDATDAGELDEVERLNHRFHRQINRSAEAPRLCGLLAMTTRYAPRQFFSRVGGWAQASASEHRDVIAGLRAVDVEATRRAMEEHIHHAGTLLVSHRAIQADRPVREVTRPRP